MHFKKNLMFVIRFATSTTETIQLKKFGVKKKLKSVTGRTVVRKKEQS